MSVTIVHDIAAARVAHGNREYVAVALKTAESNLINEDGYPSTRWNMLRPGLEWEVMQDVVELSSSCESGCLQWARGRSGMRKILPETLIRKVRTAIRKAPVVENLGHVPAFGGAFRLRWDFEKMYDYEKAEIERLKKRGVVTRIEVLEHSFSNEKSFEAEFLASAEGVAAAARFRNANLWCF